MIRLIVGLGNPGPEYAATRHNAGFRFVDEVASRLKATLVPERSYAGLAARVNVAGRPLWLLEPMTYMNLSGKSVAALARFFKIEPGEILVAHDELDVPPGQAKMKLGGGHAGHNGLRDIHAQLGSADYWRLRIGIGHPGTKADVADYVLRKPPAAERDAIERSIAQSLGALDDLLAGDMARAAMQVHARPPRPKPPRPVAAGAAGAAGAADATGARGGAETAGAAGAALAAGPAGSVTAGRQPAPSPAAVETVPAASGDLPGAYR